MIKGPSEHPNLVVENPSQETYLTPTNKTFHKEVEQSAIYSDIEFHCLKEKSNGLILTSECDILHHTRDNYVLMARTCPVGEIFFYWLFTSKGYPEEEIAGKKPIGAELPKRKKIISEFTELYLKNKTFAYYFVPGCNGVLEPSFICFEITQSLPIKSLVPENKLCVLLSPFREAVPAHFSAYIGRVGTPSYKDSYLKELVDGICKMKDP